MAVKMRKWSPWQPAAGAATRKFQVAVKPMKLEGFIEDGAGDDESDMTQKFVAIKIKWKGQPKFFPLIAPFKSKPKTDMSMKKNLTNGRGIIQWDEDHWFENTCCFSDHHDQRLGAWEMAFNILYGEKTDLKAKMAVIGRVSMNISEVVGQTSIEQKLPLSLQINGVVKEATLTVLFTFVEIRQPQDSEAIVRGGSMKLNECKSNSKARRRSLSQEEIILNDSDKSGTFETKDDPQTSLSTKKEGWFSWKSKRFSFKRAKTKDDKLVDDDPSSINHRLILQTRSCLGSESEDSTTGSWEEKELTSRDGEAMLKVPVFFASFDQRSDKAAGESACTALVAAISHWLHSNSSSMPNRSEFDNLIMQGSSEWRKLCEDVSYVNDFPNKHFDLETVLRADIRPISISHSKSFVGFFGAESFESVKGAMSFDDIWNEISSNIDVDPRIYIVSWNDHFFVLKAEVNAYYIIDTLGERLFEGCDQAYILRFDDDALMQKQSDEEIICRGRECCREFIKRFLAAIPLKELEEEEKKNAVSYFSLHQRLQIEFNYTHSSSSPSSLTSSPFSSLTTSRSSPLFE